MIRVLIAAPSEALREALAVLLSPGSGLSVVGIVDSARGLAGAVEEAEPDVLLLGLDAAAARRGLSLGAGLAPDAVGRAPGLVVVMADPSPEWAAGALRAGASAVLPHDAAPAEAHAAIEAAATGLLAVPRELAGALLGPVRAVAAVAPRAGTGAHLTSREREVLAFLAEGLGNKVIAARLGLSEHTVKTHVTAILAKLDADTRAEAVAAGVRAGLILL